MCESPLVLCHQKSEQIWVDREFPMELSMKNEEVPTAADGTTENKVLDKQQDDEEAKMKKMTDAVRTLIECVGEDPSREGLVKTPLRMAKALQFFTKGYHENLETIVGGAVFEENHEDMVIVRDIDLFSLCEHHMIPFYGKVHIGYIPNKKVLGLSKLARVSEMFSRRLQIQERLTQQIGNAIMDVLQPQGVGVVVEATHMCMCMRGAQKPGSSTITSCMVGVFRDDVKTRQEFLQLIHSKKLFS
ncbi:GTP cyclohydrolase I, putative [Acanthamoeba castellanii str. Neff]|uniref:GTP cyclohydrolase 1 n=1 Tax=Acanthamoeba castellanii (strain ATCC 30010 / Neff) TaxID=1257118 RepID=L8GI36_ACACF|nr:GTP cyclohydrolase I, putative [Acanthamoeba castellanii str. Neff]ELR12519.1 GTP cyclohydrolase I, putative [Acanthamoeba castellanii str. Neff]